MHAWNRQAAAKRFLKTGNKGLKRGHAGMVGNEFIIRVMHEVIVCNLYCNRDITHRITQVNNPES